MRKKEIKTTTLAEFLTTEELTECVALHQRALPGTFAALCDKQIIQPILPRIESTLRQKMHSRYVAYMVEHVLNEARNTAKRRDERG